MHGPHHPQQMNHPQGPMHNMHHPQGQMHHNVHGPHY